jgi:hypothetical protein
MKLCVKDFEARKGAPREALRTLRELADELGVSVRVLSGHLSRHADGTPRPRLERIGCARRTYYRRGEFLRWARGLGIGGGG